GRTWLIDHGAALYPQHSDAGLAASARDAFPLIAQHVLLPGAGSIADADARLASAAADVVSAAIQAVPDDWLGTTRDEMARFFSERLTEPRPWIEEAERGRA
ncbi:MAG: hypothetical protein QOJ29_1464, partial [Thermoleophilaceae bacterium]|nr:hypothetical protein [Thermoleophilaceae bacterium]